MNNAQYTCNACGRTFTGIGPLNYHMRTCRSGKRQLEGALSAVSQIWQERKRRKLNPPPSNLQPTPVDHILKYVGPSPQSDVNVDDMVVFVSNIFLLGKLHLTVKPSRSLILINRPQ